MTTSLVSDILVAGSGPAGLAAALALHEAGFAVALVGPEPDDADSRTTAIMRPGLDFLARFGLGPGIMAKGAPLATMRIVDATTRLLRSPTVTFHAGEVGLDAFGTNIANTDLNALLAAAVAERAGIRWHRTLMTQWEPGADKVTGHLASGDAVTGRLAVAADGRDSPARQAAGISVDSRRTGQSAIAFSFFHERHHHNTSNEFHTESGPFTQVPLPGGMRSSLVWVVHTQDVDEILNLSREALAARVEARLGSMLGKVEIDTQPRSYPLGLSLPREFTGRRIALVGEAAHVFPPIGAQGLNLGLRDVAELASCAARDPVDPGSPAVLADYEARRRPDVRMRSGAVELLNRSLLSDLLPAQLARASLFEALRAVAPLRTFFMREGMEPGSGLKSAFRVGRPKHIRS